MIVFLGAVKEVAALNKEFGGKCIVASSSNAWMNTELYVNKVLGALSFKRRLFAWDTFECHLTSTVKKSLADKRIDTVYIPGGCTSHIQAPDVCWNKPFKSHCAVKYDEWLATDGIHNVTNCGNLRPPPRREIVKWVIESWAQLSSELIAKSFVVCALAGAVDGSTDGEITCLKEGKPCSAGREMLQNQMELIDTVEENPFTPSSGDINAACPAVLQIEESDTEEDIDLNILD